MGMVWAADETETGRQVALKFIKGASTSVAMRRRFLREARAASAIDHEAIVKVTEILELEDGAPVLVMQLLEGESLAQRLDRDETILLEELAAIMQPVVSAVGTAHALGIIHRDLKPENIFLANDDDGELAVKVLDFGIAKLTAVEGTAAQSTSLTGTGSLLGTPYYMAPEQVFGEKDIDHRVDVWALGLILYECLAGVLPTEADNVGQVLKIVLTRGIPPLEEANPNIPQDITDLVNRMLSRRRDERPKDLREVHRALKRHTDAATTSFGAPIEPAEEPASADAILALDDTAIDPLGATAPATSARPQLAAPTGRNKMLALGAGAIAAAAGIWWVTQDGAGAASVSETGAGGDAATLVADDAPDPSAEGGAQPQPTASVVEGAPSSTVPTSEPSPGATSRVPSPPRQPATAPKPRPKPTAAAAPEPPTSAEPVSTASQPAGPKIQAWQ